MVQKASGSVQMGWNFGSPKKDCCVSVTTRTDDSQPASAGLVYSSYSPPLADRSTYRLLF